ncbi:MAG: methionyl-tRNA formyltransferase [Candidatus Ornithospirochaeta sp.]
MRILFAATDTIAVPLLEALCEKGLVTAVFTSPDAPGKRGKTLLPTPIKVKALEKGIPVYTPEHLRTEERRLVSELGTDTLLSFCYGKIFGPKFLSLFSRTFNVHPSPLPKYRGCSPIYASILNGERNTAISLQRIAPGIDEGELYASLPVALDGTETTLSLEEKVASLVPEFVVDALERIDEITPSPQEGEASYTGFINKDDGRIDWTRSAEEIHALVRASFPWPRAFCFLGEDKLMITGVWGSGFGVFPPSCEAPGTVVALEKGKGLKVATGKGYIYLSRVLPPMKKEMDAASYVNGNRSIIGAVLS